MNKPKNLNLKSMSSCAVFLLLLMIGYASGRVYNDAGTNRYSDREEAIYVDIRAVKEKIGHCQKF